MKKRTVFCVLAVLFILCENTYAEKKPNDILKNQDNFFEDFDPADMIIMSGGTMAIRSGGTLDVQSGATFNVSGDFTVNTSSTTAFRVQNGSAVTMLAADTSANTVTVTAPTNNSATFIVEQSGGTNVLESNTSNGSLTIRGDITFGVAASPTIYPGTGTLIRIFKPSDIASSNTLRIQGDVSIAGDLFNPAFFELQSQMKNVENLVDYKVGVLSSLEKQLIKVNKEINKVDKEVTTIKETSRFSPEALNFARTAMDKNLGGKDISQLISGRNSAADQLHMHQSFPNDVVFEKDVIVKGEGVYVGRTKDNSETVSFAEQSTQALVSEVGKAKLGNGEVTIKLDPRFLELVSINETTPVFIQLTPAGNCNGLYVERIMKTGFTVKEQLDGESNVAFYWKIEAVRQGLEGVKYFTPQQYEEIRKGNVRR